MPAATQSRQVRRAETRLFKKLHASTYPKGLTDSGLRIQRYEPFQPRGENYNDGRPLGQQEAARRLRRASLSGAR